MKFYKMGLNYKANFRTIQSLLFFFYIQTQMQSSQKDESQIMMDLVDKLCDHLPNDRIKLFIDNGFDEWETVTYIKGPQLIELGFTSEEIIVIMVAINSNAKSHKLPQVFAEEQIQQTLKLAKENDLMRLEEIQKQEEELQQQRFNKEKHLQQQQKSQQVKHISIKQYPLKILEENLMIKCIPGQKTQQKPSDKTSLQKVTLLQLQGKEITKLSEQEMKKIPSIQNLYLANNHIYKIEGLLSLTKIKILRLQNNLIKKIEGLQALVNLEKLTLNQNYLQKIENLHNNKRLHDLDVSSQKHKFEVTFDEQTFASLAYSLEKLECNNNYVKNIDAFRHLAVAQEISLKNNQLQEISELTAALTQMQRIKKIDFRGNPICKVPKYRDYIVILSKSLEELDDKKILPKQREYLVKLYSLKHAKQQKEILGQVKKQPTSNKNLDLHGTKMQQHEMSHNPPKYVHGGDLRGNVAYANTKVVKK